MWLTCINVMCFIFSFEYVYFLHLKNSTTKYEYEYGYLHKIWTYTKDAESIRRILSSGKEVGQP